MRWPLLHPSPFSEKPETICPLCMYDYVLLDEPPGVDEGSPMSFSALLPPEFYPCPAYVTPTDGSGPPRAVRLPCPVVEVHQKLRELCCWVFARRGPAGRRREQLNMRETACRRGGR
eukprot:2887479-Rhodomonas_salina.4